MSLQCCGRVWDDMSRRHYPCHRSAKYMRNGQWYCGIHDPEKVAARRAKVDEKWRRKQEQFVAVANKKKQDEADAARYRWLRSAMYRQTIAMREARIDFRVIGACPSIEEFDAEIDLQMEQDARYTLTEAGRAALEKK